MSRPIITLTTDFGSGDHEAGVLKGVIWNIAPGVKIADLSHDIPPQDVLGGALLLKRCSPHFPPGTIHVVVVDPGVGTERRGMAARLGEHIFVGPDNGVFTLALENAERQNLPIEITDLSNPKYWLDDVSQVFHGRDVFSPVAAHLANGVPLPALGSPIKDPIRLDMPQPVKTPSGWHTAVIHIDHFGNLSTPITKENLANKKDITVKIAGREIHGLAKTFGDGKPGDLVSLIDSNGMLAIAVVNGSAANRLQSKIGTPIEITL